MTFNKPYFLTLILLVLIQNVAYAQEKWNQILEKNLHNLPEIELTDKSDRDQLIALYEIGNKEEIISVIDSYLDKKYDPILMSIYLSHKLYHSREELPVNIKKRLDIFRENESSESSIPDFLSSYYHFTKHENQTSIYFLKNANKINKYNDFSHERKISTFSFLKKKTNNIIYSYTNSSFIITNIPSFALYMAHKIGQSSNNEFNNELILFAEIMHKRSTNLFNLTSSILVLSKCIDKNKSPELYSKIDKEKKQLPKLLNFVSDSNEKAEGEESFIKYLELAYNSGELVALNTYFPYEYDENVDEEKEIEKMVSRIKAMFEQFIKENEASTKNQTAH